MHYANIRFENLQNWGHHVTSPLRKGDSYNTEYVYSVSSPAFTVSSTQYDDMNHSMFRPRDLSQLLGTVIIYTS